MDNATPETFVDNVVVSKIKPSAAVRSDSMKYHIEFSEPWLSSQMTVPSIGQCSVCGCKRFYISVDKSGVWLCGTPICFDCWPVE